MSDSPTITIQRAGGKESVFRVGEAAAQLLTKLDHCRLWVEDLQRWSWVICGSGLPTVGLAAYCVAAVDSDVWPLVLLQASFCAMGPLWWFAARWRSERVLKWTLYLTVCMLMVAAGAVLLWMTIYLGVRDKMLWLWWTLLGVQLVQVLTVLCGVKSLANVYSALLAVHLNVNMHRAIVKNAETARALDNNAGQTVGSGAMALSSGTHVVKRRAADDKKK